MPRKSKKKDTSSALAGTLAAFNQADATSPAINLTSPPPESEADKPTPSVEQVADKPDSDPAVEPEPEPVTAKPKPEPTSTSETTAPEPTESDSPDKKRFQLDVELLQAYEKWQQNFERSSCQPLNRKLFVTLCQQGLIPPPPVDIYLASEKTRWAYARQALQQALRYHTATVLNTLVDLQKNE